LNLLPPQIHSTRMVHIGRSAQNPRFYLFLQVFKALRNGVQIVAVKVFREEMTRGAITSLSSSYHAAQFRQEISILKSCHDKNIVQFVGACLTVRPLYSRTAISGLVSVWLTESWLVL
jgi:hypothetical protein